MHVIRYADNNVLQKINHKINYDCPLSPKTIISKLLADFPQIVTYESRLQDFYDLYRQLPKITKIDMLLFNQIAKTTFKL